MNNSLDIEAQVKDIGFKSFNNENNGIKCYVNAKSAPMGSQMLGMVNYASLPQSGPDKVRGVSTILIKKTKKYFKKMKMAVSKEIGSDVFEICKRVLGAWKREHDPVKQSMWYQKTFGFQDGTQVYEATAAITDPSLYASMHIEDDTFNSPGGTFGPALFGGSDNAIWYIDCTVPEPEDVRNGSESVLYLYDENNKRLKTRTFEGTTVYSTSGIELGDNAKLKELAKSDFYTSMTFRARCCLGLSSLEWKCGVDTATGKKTIYPIFHFKTYGSIVLKSFPYVAPEGQVPAEKRMIISDSLLFDGLEAPTKKRKKTFVTPKKVPEKVQFEKETLISDEEIKGDATQPYDDSDAEE